LYIPRHGKKNQKRKGHEAKGIRVLAREKSEKRLQKRESGDFYAGDEKKAVTGKKKDFSITSVK